MRWNEKIRPLWPEELRTVYHDNYILQSSSLPAYATAPTIDPMTAP